MAFRDVVDRVFGSFGGFGFGAYYDSYAGHKTKAQLGMDLAYNAVPILRATVSTIATDVASRLEWKLYRKPGASASSMSMISNLAPRERRARVDRMVADGSLKEIEDHPVLNLLSYYNKALGANASEQVLQTWVDLFGIAYLLIDSTMMGPRAITGELVPIHPSWVKKKKDSDQYEITRDGDKKTFARDDLVIVRDIDPADPYSGGSGLAEAMREELSADEMAVLETTSFFRNGSMPGQVFMAKGASEDQILRMKGQYEDLNRGPDKSWKTFWVDNELKIHERTSKFADADVSGLRTNLRDNVITGFGVPPGILGINVHENRATSVEAETFYSGHVMVPRMERFKDAYQRQLLPRFEADLLLDYVHPEIKDLDFLLEVAKAMPEALSRYDWRMLFGMEIDDSDAEKDKKLFLFRSAVKLIRQNDDDDYETLIKPGSGAGPAPPPAPGGDDDDSDDDPDGDEGGDGDDGNDDTPVSDDDSDDDDSDDDDSSKGGGLSGGGGKGGRRRILIHLDPVVATISAARLTDEVNDDYWKIVSKFGASALAEVGSDLPFRENDDRILRWIDQRQAVQIKGANAETAKAIRANLLAGMENAEDIDELKKRVRNVFRDARTWRARTIARTETIGSANFATFEGHRQSGVVNRREWIATLDERTREDHLALHGDIVTMEGLFEADDGSVAMFPGGFGVAHQDINCRCTTAAVIEDVDRSFGSDAHVALIRAFEDKAKPLERTFERHLRTGFAKQQADVIEAIDVQLAA